MILNNNLYLSFTLHVSYKTVSSVHISGVY